jgi:putative PIN family toxin of toxin-antitoxin system
LKIVLDTNVLVSALLTPNGTPAAVLQLILSGRVAICFDARILSEYREVLGRAKFGFDARLTEDVLDFLEAEGNLAMAVPLALALPDRADAMFIEVGVAAAADHLVTGNLKHFPVSQRQGLSVVSPREFVEAVITA